MKWSADNDKESLAKIQELVDGALKSLKSVDGVKSVQRVVCGGCLDYKIITSLDAGKFGAWEEKGFTPEADFLKQVSSIKGVSVVETQTYTIMPM
jgi:hypothetical protein